MKYGLVVFGKNTIIDDDLHEKICNQIITQMSGCNILFNHNLWFRIARIKTK